MSDLIEKLKQADGASRELDNDVWEFLGQGVIQHPWGKEHRYAPPISSSIDAALALVGEVLPGVLVDLTEGEAGGGFPPFHAQLKFPPDRDGCARRVDAWAKSRAISALVALLEALSAKENG